MNFEKAFRDTLIKWQQIAAGALLSPASDCGLCGWAEEKRRKPEEHKCDHCPAWFHYREIACGDTVPMIGEAIVFYEEMEACNEADDLASLREVAQEVVIELLAIKDSLSKWAAFLDAQEEEQHG